MITISAGYMNLIIVLFVLFGCGMFWLGWTWGKMRGHDESKPDAPKSEGLKVFECSRCDGIGIRWTGAPDGYVLCTCPASKEWKGIYPESRW